MKTNRTEIFKTLRFSIFVTSLKSKNKLFNKQSFLKITKNEKKSLSRPAFAWSNK